MIAENTHQKQTVERVEILAYLDQDTLTTIYAVIVNNILSHLDLGSHNRADFQDLESDVRSGLEFYNVADFQYFNI